MLVCSVYIITIFAPVIRTQKLCQDDKTREQALAWMREVASKAKPMRVSLGDPTTGETRYGTRTCKFERFFSAKA